MRVNLEQKRALKRKNNAGTIGLTFRNFVQLKSPNGKTLFANDIGLECENTNIFQKHKNH